MRFEITMKKFFCIIAAVCLFCPALSFSSEQTKNTPNIVMIVVDDLGWTDVAYNGHGNPFKTPNIDELAANGLVFSEAYAGAANCAPSRAVLMSGQYTPRHGIYTVSPSDRGEDKTRRLIPVENTDALPQSVLTLAEFLRANGYTTGHFGKWHLGEDPRTQGFDHNVAGHEKGHPKSYFSPYDMPFISDGPKGEYLPDRITSEAIDWIGKSKNRPFFAYIPYYTVHTKLQAPDEVVAKYRNQRHIKDEKQAIYAAMVELMDKNVGRIVEHLDSFGLARDTLIIFTSDNGGVRSIAPQDPLRAGKGSYYEGGLRVPLIFHWPEQILPGYSRTPIINADFYPTLASIINAPLPDQPLDGVDLSALLTKGEPLAERALFWHFPIYLQAYNSKADQSQDPLFRTRPGSAMRKGKWKLIHYFEQDEYELYDLENDLSEHVNFAPYYPEDLRDLQEELASWRSEIGAPMPYGIDPEYDADFEVRKIIEKLSNKK